MGPSSGALGKPFLLVSLDPAQLALAACQEEEEEEWAESPLSALRQNLSQFGEVWGSGILDHH
jgi:hypothetical protein